MPMPIPSVTRPRSEASELVRLHALLDAHAGRPITLHEPDAPAVTVTGCPTWCELHSQPHSVNELNPGRGATYSVMHSRKVSAWSIDMMSYHDCLGRMLGRGEPEISPEFESVATADIRQTAAELAEVAALLEGE